MIYVVGDLPDRIAVKIVIRSDGCWEWTGAIQKPCPANPLGGGYGRVRVCREGRRGHVYAHRFAYVSLVGDIPTDRPVLDHTCCDPAWCAGGATCPHRRCVNPAHLEPVTHAENRRRAIRLQDVCDDGHPFDVENTRVDPRSGNRICRACARRRHRAYRVAGVA